ncbi:MAG: PAS domain S-box protein, partial [Ignavibacteriaceae bacterium]|nr:PAS domain S-box protein [Ignavibacteriaceae bacterium]
LTGWLEKESIGKPLNKVFRIINEYSREEVPNPVTRVLAEGIIIGLANHTLLIHKNGNEFPIADSGAPIKDDQGNIVGVVLVFRDQLEEREQQKILEESEHRFRAIVENAPEPIFIQTNKKFAYLNPSACRLFKIQDQSELIGTPIIERFHPDYHSKIGERIQVLNIERQPVDTHLELKAFRIDGSEVWVETAGAPINYNNENGALVFMRDISERKKNEAIIRESEERIKFALETSNIGAWELDLIDHSANRSLIHDQIFGYKELLPVWTYEMFISHVHPEDRDYVDNRFQTAVKKRQDWNFECRIFRVDGELRWIWAAGRQIFIDKKNPRKLAGIVQDITERKKIELAVKESEEKYRTLIEVSREAIFINYNDKIVYLNPTAVILLGAENEDQIIGKSPFEIFHSDFHETIRERIIRMLEKNESVPLIEEKIIRLDGKLVDVEVSATPFLYRGEQAIQVVLRDITERKLAEQELRTSEKIFTHSIDMLCIAGFDGYFKVLNPSWSKVLGWSTEELLSKPWNDFVHPEDILKTDNIKSTIVDGKEIYQFENRYICKDGSIKWLAWNSFPYPEENIMFGVARDVTDKKSTEDTLRESEEKFRQLFENHSAVKLLIDPETNQIVDVNKAASRFYGWSVEELKKMYITQINTLDEKEILTSMERAKKQEQIFFEFQHRLANGSIRDVEVYSSRIEIGKKTFLHSIIHDITERKLTQKNLKESEEKLSSIFRVAPVGIGVVVERVLVEVNLLITEMTGYTKEEIIGKSARMLYPSQEEFDLVGEKKYKQIKAKGTGVIETKWKKKNGELIEILLASTPLDRDDLLRGVIFTALDITDRKKSERELNQYRQNLEKLVVERTEELDHLNKDLIEQLQKEKELEEQLNIALSKEKEINELKTRFIATVSHEFRTPLAALLSSSQMIQRYSKNWSEEKLNDHYNRISSTVNYLTQLLDDVLTISRAERDILTKNPELVDIENLINTYLAEIKTFTSAKHNLIFTFKGDSKTLYLDKKLLRHIIINLLTNAIKYSPNGGKIEMNVLLDNGKLNIIIADEGMGISEDEIKYIYEPFYRTKNSIGIQGSGLGLNITKRAVEILDGEISVSSKQNKGTTFNVSIPIEEK